MNRELIGAIRGRLASEPKAFLLHSNADLDCVGASAALAIFFGDSILCAPEGVSHLGKRLLDVAGIDASASLDAVKGRTPVAVDAKDEQSIGYPGVPWEWAIVIDHHCGPGVGASLMLLDESALSSCELAWDVMGRPETLGRLAGICLLAGLMADTGHLRRGDHRTLEAAAGILRAAGLRLEDLQPFLEAAGDQDVSRRVSRLKGAQRLRFERAGDWVVATSEIGAFESAVCGALISVGADIALAGSAREGSFRIAGRAARQAVDAGLNLGEMFARLARECGGEGGGHDGAAGFSGEGDVEAMLNICAREALEAVSGRPRSAQDRKPIIQNCD
jgi:nanoRNase/pAp phosphatase (c-di-AMP/oligoRNAs hydrolase)